MLIKIFKQRTLQISQFEPISFGFGLEEEMGAGIKEIKINELKTLMEKTVDEWLEKETAKWQKYKSLTGSAVAPKKERDAVPF